MDWIKPICKPLAARAARRVLIRMIEADDGRGPGDRPPLAAVRGR